MYVVTGAQDASLNFSAAYDAIAAGYDDQVRGDDWMRRVLHQQYARRFRPGQRVLDVGCGTGIDTLALAQRGIHVLAIDGSAAMIEVLRAKVRPCALEGRVATRVLNIQDLHQLDEEPFDGLIAAFASLSTLTDLTAFAENAARLVRPRGHLIIHMLNRFSLWEWLGYVSKRNWPAARDVGRLRTRAFVIGGQPVEHTMYFADEAYGYFAARFARRERYSLGALRPPHTVRRFPSSVLNGLQWLDVRTASWPLVRNAGRFFVLDLQRLFV